MRDVVWFSVNAHCIVGRPGLSPNLRTSLQFSQVEDQSQTNSCCANAVAGAYEYINKRYCHVQRRHPFSVRVGVFGSGFLWWGISSSRSLGSDVFFCIFIPKLGGWIPSWTHMLSFSHWSWGGKSRFLEADECLENDIMIDVKMWMFFSSNHSVGWINPYKMVG